MTTKEGQFATKEGRSRGTKPTTGEQNPLLHVPLGMSPSTPNEPQPSVGDEARSQPGRYEVWSGKSVPAGEKSATNHPRLADENVYHQEDPAQASRHLTPEATGIRIIKKGEKQ
jgi:hypothetical protein